MEIEEDKLNIGNTSVHKSTNNRTNLKNTSPTSPAFIGATWLVLIVGIVCYLIGLYNAEMELNEKGYYLTILLFGLFSVITLQKSVRDKAEGVPVTNIFYSISWFGTIASILLLVIGLWNAELLLSEKGFYGIAFLMSLYAAVSAQKNIRDTEREKE